MQTQCESPKAPLELPDRFYLTLIRLAWAVAQRQAEAAQRERLAVVRGLASDA